MSVSVLKAQLRRRVEDRLDRAAQDYLNDSALPAIDFSRPPGAPALSEPDSISWRIFKNPVTLFIGGVAAVILELAEPRVRAGVWEHSRFRTDPVGRLKRTGLAAMVTVYGPQHTAKTMIARINEVHARIKGRTAGGAVYRASDPELLTWVHATAAFGFVEAYRVYAAPLHDEELDRYHGEARRTAALYGAVDAPVGVEAQRALFEAMASKLEASDVIIDFLRIMKNAKTFPGAAQVAQHSLVRAAVDLTPADIRARIGLGPRYGLRPLEGALVRRMARRADRLVLRSGPPAQSCRRVGLPDDYLYRR